MLDGVHDGGWLDAVEPRDEPIFVLATGHRATRATFTAELARRLHAAHLAAGVIDGALRLAGVDGRRSAVGPLLAALTDAQLRAGISVVVDADLELELEVELNRVRQSHPHVPVVRVQALEGQSLRPDRLVGEVIERAHRRRS